MASKSIKVTVREKYCKGCGLCVEVCSEGKLRMSPRPNARGVRTVVVEPNVPCTGCLKCATVCPDAAVRIVQVPAQAPQEKARAQEHE